MTDVTTLDRRRVTGWRNAVIVAFGIGGITVSSWGVRLPALTDELQVSTGTIGAVLAFVTVGSIGGLLASTPVAHWFGGRRGVPAALLVIAVALALLSLGVATRSIPLLVVAFAVVGFGIGLLDVLLNVEGAAIEAAAARTLMPLMHAAWSVGVAVGSGIGAACAALDVAPSEQFLGEAVLIAIVAVGVARAMPAHAAPVEDDAEPQRMGDAVRAWLRGWRDVRLLLIGVVLLGVELGEGSANTWLTLGVQREHGQTAAIAALFFTAFAVGEALTRILAGPLVDRIGRVAALRITTAVGVVGLLLFILGGGWVVLLGVLLWSVGVSMGFPLGLSAAAEGGGANPAARVSVVASIGYFASLAGPPVLGTLAEHVGLLGSFWLLVAFMLAAFAAAGSVAKPRVPASSTL
jgi:fucose permease